MPQVVALAALLAVTALVGVAWRARQGRVRVTAPVAAPAQDQAARWAGRGVALGERATFLQLSAEVCAPCRATARVLGTLATNEPGVAHHELDVDEHLDLVKELKVLTTPTVLLLDPDGVEVARASGAMTPAQARQALALCG
ncbi:thioredoxin family protein [Xylanimonas protaetiae]|uniref:Thioredoxin n=1 Tax=Xylanimonas protaetiae TaxID=2509457 RepID=A0A4P6F225_9MICO|nr:thioredoxin family protein [Xylanimonas protaetiae]QAY69226.1 thioredoxin [Xylanimonas protaetiae]